MASEEIDHRGHRERRGGEVYRFLSERHFRLERALDGQKENGWEKCAFPAVAGGPLLRFGALDGGVFETGVFLEEGQGHVAGGAVSLFGDD